MIASSRISARQTPRPPDVPYTMKLPDGRSLFVEVPGRWAVLDRGGQIGFTPEGVRFLDRLRALAMGVPARPTPGQLVALRQGLGLTQSQMGQRLGVNKLTVSRYERGTLHPGPQRLKVLERLRRQATRRGVLLND